jgi:hypothetical protein
MLFTLGNLSRASPRISVTVEMEIKRERFPGNRAY